MRSRRILEARGGPRPLVLVGLVVALWAHVACLAHLVLVRYVACAEHGELVHAGDWPGARATARRSLANSVRTGAAAEEEHHEHCAIGAHRRDQVAYAPGGRVTSTVEIVRPGGATLVTFRPDSHTPVALALYAVAPKTSPPA